MCLCLVLCGLSCWWHLLLVVLCGHQCTSAITWSVRLHLRWGMSVVCLWWAVCLFLMFCSACMCYLEIFAIVMCLVLLMYTLAIWSSVLCVLIVEGMSVAVNVMLSLMSVVSPPPAFRCFDFRSELGFLNCVDICMCFVNKQFELLEFVFESVYVDFAVWWDISHFYCLVYVLVWCLQSWLVLGLSVWLS